MEIPVLNEIMRDTVVEVDLDRIAFNVRQIKAMAGPGIQVAAVVKAEDVYKRQLLLCLLTLLTSFAYSLWPGSLTMPTAYQHI